MIFFITIKTTLKMAFFEKKEAPKEVVEQKTSTPSPIDPSSILAEKIEKIEKIDEMIDKLSENPLIDELKSLKKDKALLEQEVELTIFDNTYLLGKKGEVQVRNYRCRISTSVNPVLTETADLEVVLSEAPTALDVKISKTGVKMMVKKPGGEEKLKQLGIVFKEEQSIKIEKLKSKK